MRFIEENPWTCILTLMGILIGLTLPSDLDVFSNFDYSQISKDPAEFLVDYVIAFPIAMSIKIISGIIGGLIGIIIGLFIDGKIN